MGFVSPLRHKTTRWRRELGRQCDGIAGRASSLASAGWVRWTAMPPVWVSSIVRAAIVMVLRT